MPRWAILAAMLLAWAGVATAGDVVSARPDTVAVTIYRDRPVSTAQLADLGADDTHGLALVVETRTVDLPAGRSRLCFEGVADGIIPQSAAVEGLAAAIVERNFDYDLLSPGSLIAHSIDQKVRVARTDPRTGRESEDAATVRSGPDGVVLDFGGRFEALRCGGETERLVFDQAPAGLTDRPTLSVVVDAPAPGRFTVRVSYLTVRLDWSADYIARINPDGATLNLTGWITLANRGAMSFADAPTEVVAGNLARQPVDLPRSEARTVQTACWPNQTTHSGWYSARAYTEGMPMPPPPPPPPMARAMTVAEMVVTAQKRVIESQLGDYKLYTLAEPTTVAARQTKQVMFLSQPDVKFETVYVHAVSDSDDDHPPGVEPASVVLRFENKPAGGLGRPLPAGSIGVRRPGDGRELFVGEYPLSRDVPVGEPFEITTGAASDVTFAQRLVRHEQGRRGHVSNAFEIIVANAKAAPVTVEVRHPRDQAKGFKVAAESDPHGFKAGDPVWRLIIPPGEDRTLTYAVEFDQR